ncbi:hypothetical protein HYQ46_005063 [Verticillium longisporum]|nr:hypothetical protein HYQ46_005063 [Verticillium longisporum]
MFINVPARRHLSRNTPFINGNTELPSRNAVPFQTRLAIVFVEVDVFSRRNWLVSVGVAKVLVALAVLFRVANKHAGWGQHAGLAVLCRRNVSQNATNTSIIKDVPKAELCTFKLSLKTLETLQDGIRLSTEHWRWLLRGTEERRVIVFF